MIRCCEVLQGKTHVVNLEPWNAKSTPEALGKRRLASARISSNEEDGPFWVVNMFVVWLIHHYVLVCAIILPAYRLSDVEIRVSEPSSQMANADPSVRFARLYPTPQSPPRPL